MYVASTVEAASARARSTSPSSRAVTAFSPDSSSRRCSASSSAVLRRSAFVSSHSTTRARSPRCASATVSATTATPSSIGTTAVTPGLGERRLVIDRGDRGAEPRRVQHNRRQHPWEAQVDRELGGAENLRDGVDAQPPLAPDQLVVGRVLRLRRHREPEAARPAPRARRSVACLPLAWRSNAVLDLDLIGGHLPRLGRRGHEPRPRLSGGQPVAHPEPLHRVRRARQLEGAAEVGIAVDVAVRARSRSRR